MLFNSLGFVLFFAVALGVHYLPLPWRVRKFNLVVASSLFYAAWNPLYLLLLWISICVDWHIATRMVQFQAKTRKRLLMISLVVNLGMLCLFKYGNFLSGNAAAFASLLGIHYDPSPLGLILPVGISFYTFETLSYTIDAYRGEPVWTSFLDFVLFLTFFPHLVAGPIVRPHDFLPQCTTPTRATAAQLGWGLTLLTLGLFEKVVIADGALAPAVDLVFQQSPQIGTLDAWCGALAFSGQVFCDFAGYSTCAIGVALCFGFVLPDNFNCPYASLGFSDFWRRWHISLSTWLRDYLYVSLGGNRVGLARTYANLLITMLLGGLWHGASWTFVAWGGLHGIYLIGERALGTIVAGRAALNGRVGRSLGVALTFVLTTVAWVFFRSTSFDAAFDVLSAMRGAHDAPAFGVVGIRNLVAVFAIMTAMLAVQWSLRDRTLASVVRRIPWQARGALLATVLILILTETSTDRAFIYFQF
jgi:alginate O-acetyltransferase complex protein AlgI